MSIPLARLSVVSAFCLLLTANVPAQLIDNETVEIIDSFQSFPGYGVEFSIDVGPGSELSDYASFGGAVDTFIEFDLGDTYTLSEIVYTDRVTSGGGNHTWIGGLHDFVFLFNYILSVDDSFTNGDGQSDDIVIEVEAEEPPGAVLDPAEIELFQTSAAMPEIPIRFVRWEIVENRGNNPGANNFDFIAAGGGGLPGDFNQNGDLDAGDLDLLATQQQAGAAADLAYDLNSDGSVNLDDRVLWVGSPDYKHSWMGDADLNGEFNSSDLVTVLASGTYEADIAATWSTGDFDGDGRTNSSDLVAALADGGYEAGPRAAVAAVPEPGTLALLLTSSLFALFATRRR